MPVVVPAEAIVVPMDTPVSSDNLESQPLVLRELLAVNPSATTFSNLLWIPQQAWQWLAQLLRLQGESLTAEDIELAEIMANGRNMRLDAEAVEHALRQAQEAPSRGGCSGRNIMLSLFATTVTLIGAGAFFTRYGRAEEGETTLSGNHTGMGFPRTNDPDFILPAAVVERRTTPPPAPMPDWLPSLMNSTRDDLIARFSGIQPEPLMQMLIVPLVKSLFARASPGLAQSFIQQQLPMLTSILFSTLSTPELIRLYSRADVTGDNAVISGRYSIISATAYISIDRLALRLRAMPDSTPFIIDNEGCCRFVRFNQLKMQWEFVSEVNNHGYSTENQQWIKRYSESLAFLSPEAKFKYDPVRQRVSIHDPGKKDIEGVFAGGHFIPIVTGNTRGVLSKVPGNNSTPMTLTQARAACTPATSAPWLRASAYGWGFDPVTGRMDEALKILLDNPVSCIRRRPRKLTGGVNLTDGLFYDDQGLTYLKKDERYFSVELRHNKVTDNNELTLSDFADTALEYRDGVMLLKRAADMIFALENTQVGNAGGVVSPFTIESGALNYLQRNALKTDILPAKALPLPGLYRGHDDSFIFFTHDASYAVRNYSIADNLIQIKNADSADVPQDDIFLWLAGDVVLRVRNGRVDTEYQKAPFNYVNDTQSISVQVEKELHQSLQKEINTYPLASITPDGTNLVERSLFPLPVFWSDIKNHRHYFRYDEHYFPARLTLSGAAKKSPGIDYLTIFSRGDNQPVTTLVVEKKKDCIELKSRESYLAEKVHVSKRAAALYLKNSPWRATPGARDAELAVSVMMSNGQFYVAPVPEGVAKKAASDSALSRLKMIARTLYPERVNNQQLTFSRIQDTVLTTDGKKRQQSILSAVQKIKYTLLWPLNRALNFDSADWPIIEKMLTDDLQIHHIELLTAVAASWRKRLQTINNQINENHIYISNGTQEHLRPHEQSRDPIVFIPADDKNIYINSDKINADDNIQMRLISGLIEGMATSSGIGQNIIHLRQANGMYPPLRDMLAALNSALMRGTLSAGQLLNMQKVSRQYLENVSAYQPHIDALLHPQLLALLAESDPAFRAHLILNCDAFLTGMTLEAYYRVQLANNAANQDDSWIKTYATWLAGYRPTFIDEMVSSANATTPSPSREFPHIHNHPPEFPHRRKPERTIAHGERVEQEETDPLKAAKPAEPYRDADAGSISAPDSESESGSDTGPESSQEAGSENGSDTDLSMSHESGSEEGYDADRESGQDIGNEERSDSDSDSSRESGYDADNESGSISRTDSETGSRPSGGSRSPGINPLHPLPQPAIPAGAAASSILAIGGMGMVAAAPKIPVVDVNTPATTTEAAATTGVTTLTYGHAHEDEKRLRLPEDDAKNRRGMSAPDSHDDILLPGLSKDLRGSGTGDEETIWIHSHGNVTRLTIKGLECLGNKDVTVSEVIRWIGEALTNTVTANVLAQKEGINIDVEGKDCPSAEDTKWLADRTMLIDAAINTLISFVPPLAVVAVLKNFVGPAMITLADDMEGKEVKPQDRVNLLQNALWQFISNTHAGVTSLNGNEWVVDKKNAPATSTFNKHFKYGKEGHLFVNIDKKDYPLGTTYDETPMVIDDKGYRRIIAYNQEEKHWDFDLDFEQTMADETRRNRHKYRMDMSELPEDAVMERNDHDSFTLKLDDETEITGVFIGLDFIPARVKKVGNEYVAYTTTDSVNWQDERLLVHSRYGWDFERPSVKMESYLDILLSQHENVALDVEQRYFSSIQKADGLSYDNLGRSYIKRNYKYHRVNAITPRESHNEYTLPDYNNARMRFENDYFTLEYDENILFASKIKEIHDVSEDFYIESAALEYLRSHAVTSNAVAAARFDMGVYRNADESSTIFIVDEEQYVVTHFNDREVQIKRVPAGEKRSDIKLWLDKDTWWRVRDDSDELDAEPDYAVIGLCRTARSPTKVTACGGLNAQVAMEPDLAKRLKNEISIQMTSDSAPEFEKLTKVTDTNIPFLYKDSATQKYFFKFRDEYFNAKIIDPQDVDDNPSGFPCLRLTGRSDFYNAEKNIATVVFSNENDSTQIKDMATFIKETLGISREQAVQYLKRTPYNEMPDLPIVEKLTTAAQMADHLFVEQPKDIPEPVRNTITADELLASAISNLFPQHTTKSQRETIRFYNLRNPVINHPSYIRETVMFIRKKVDYLSKTILPGVIKSLEAENYNHGLVETYLMEILKKYDTPFLNDVEYSLSYRLISANKEISERNIKLMSDQETVPIETIRSPINQDEIIFIHPDDKNTIFINIDKLAIKDNQVTRPAPELTGAILNTVLRATGKTAHIFDVPRKNGIYVNVKDAYRSIQKAINKSKWLEGEYPTLQNIIARYFQNTSIYFKDGEVFSNVPNNWLKYNYLLRYEPGFRTHLTLNSDDFVTLIAQDLHYMLETSVKDMTLLHPWIKKYGELRGVMTPQLDTPQYPELIIRYVDDFKKMSRVNVEGKVVSAVKGKKNLFSTPEHEYLMLWDGYYYDVTFIGKSSNLIAVGSSQDVRVIFYYEPKRGTVRLVAEEFARPKVLRYFEDLDLYETRMIGSDYSEILRFDEKKTKLVPTGAIRISRLPGKISRIEFPAFNIYHPHNAVTDVYLQGHGKLISGVTKVPEHMQLALYTSPGQQIAPFKGGADDLLSGEFKVQKTLNMGKKFENYLIRPFSSVPENYYHLARKYNKDVIQISAVSVSSEDLLQSLSALYGPDNVVLNLFICRGTEPKTITTTSAVKVSGTPEEDYFMVGPNRESTASRWAFDQQVAGGGIAADGSLAGLLPYREINVPLRDETTTAMVATIVKAFFRKVPYDFYYGLDTLASDNVPEYIVKARQRLSRSFGEARYRIELADAILKGTVYQNNLTTFLEKMFGLANKDVRYLNAVKMRLQSSIERMREFMTESAEKDYRNIVVISSKKTEDPHIKGLFHSAIKNPDVVKKLALGFVIPSDPLRRIFIFEDSSPEIIKEGEIIDIRERSEPHTIVHESSHIATRTLDFFYFPEGEPGMVDYSVPEKNIYRLDALLNKGNIERTPICQTFMPHYYRYLGLKPSLTTKEIVELINSNTWVKTSLLMENADTIAMAIMGISKLKYDGATRRKREADDSTNDVDFNFIKALFVATRDHHVKNVE